MEPSFVSGKVIESPRKRSVDSVLPQPSAQKKAKGLKVIYNVKAVFPPCFPS